MDSPLEEQTIRPQLEVLSASTSLLSQKIESASSLTRTSDQFSGPSNANTLNHPECFLDDAGETPHLSGTVENTTNTRDIPTAEEGSGGSTLVMQHVQQVPARIPYENGFGDFCFGRLIDRCSYWVKDPATRSLEHWMKGSHGVPVKEINNYTRTGVFQFFKLPKELRHRIMRFILAPFYTYDEHTMSFCIDLFIIQSGDLNTGTDQANRFSLDFQHYLKTTTEHRGQVLATEGIASLKMSRYECVQAEARFMYKKEAFNHLNRSCPNRRGDYEIYARPVRKGFDWSSSGRSARDIVYIDWIRQISNTSTMFRQELGENFWAKIKVEIDTDQDLLPIQALLLERPLTRSGFKIISLAMDLEDPGVTNDYAGEDHLSICNSIAGMAPTGVFSSFTILASEEDFLAMIYDKSQEEKKGRVQRLGSLLATDSFELDIGFYGITYTSEDHPYPSDSEDDSDNDSDVEKYEDEDEIEDRHRERMKPLIRALMLGDRFKSKSDSPATEMSVYLQNRLS